MKLISWNLLHSIGAGLDQVAALVADERPDLLLMQEATAAIDPLPARIGGHYVRSPLPGRLHGLAAWSPQPFPQPPSVLGLQRGLIVRRACQILKFAEFGVANVHLSHGQMLNRLQLRRIASILPRRAVIIGDCNMLGPALLPGFRDAGHRTSTHAAGRLVPVRLDRCFLRDLEGVEARVLAKRNSDHCPIVIRLRLPGSD